MVYDAVPSIATPVAADSARRQPTGVPPIAQAGLGIVTPYDFALDRELWRWTPDAVSLHLTRLPAAGAAVTVAMVTALGDTDDVTAAARQLTTVRPHLIAYACTSGSFVSGLAGERRIRQAVRAAGAPRALTTSGALVAALDALTVRTVAIATPYTADLTARLATYLGETGRTVVGVANLGIERDIWTLDYEQVAELVRDADRPDADAIVISCTNVPTYDLIVPLEAELAKPVISANQATMWAALRAMGYRAVGAGQRLLDAGVDTAVSSAAPPGHGAAAPPGAGTGAAQDPGGADPPLATVHGLDTAS